MSALGAASRHGDRADAPRREAILDAAGELLAGQRWNEVTMAEVAGRAGVSRQTLYNAFGSRPALAQAYVLREAERFLETVADAVRSNPRDPRAALRAALEIFLAAAETHPLVRAIAGSDSADELLPLVSTRGAPVIGMVTERLADLLIETWPGLEREETLLLCDTLVRLAISQAALPSGSPESTARSTAEILGPYLDGLLERLDAAA